MRCCQASLEVLLFFEGLGLVFVKTDLPLTFGFGLDLQAAFVETPERVLSLQRGALALLHRQRRRDVLKRKRSCGKSSVLPVRDRLLSNPSFPSLTSRSPRKADHDASDTTAFATGACDEADLSCRVRCLSAPLSSLQAPGKYPCKVARTPEALAPVRGATVLL